MEALAKVLEQLDWVGIAATVVQITVILLVARVFLTLVKRPLRRLEEHLIKRGEAQGQAVEETAKRADTLSRLLRQTVGVAV